MNKPLLTLASLSLLLTPNAFAVKLVSGDNSNLTEVCIAAAESEQALQSKADEFGFTKADLNSFSCNGMTLKDFAAKFRSDTSGKPVVVYTFENTGDNRETELCIAAATSNEAYATAKESLFGGKVEAVSCNGLSLEKFAKRYGNRGFKK